MLGGLKKKIEGVLDWSIGHYGNGPVWCSKPLENDILDQGEHNFSYYCTFGANRPFLFLHISWEIGMTGKRDWCNNQVEMVIEWNCGYGNLPMQLDMQLVWGTILAQRATPQQGTNTSDL